MGHRDQGCASIANCGLHSILTVEAMRAWCQARCVQFDATAAVPQGPIAHTSSYSEYITMKVTQEKLPASQVGLEIEVPAELSQKTYDKVVNNLIRTARIPGFRPGKVPKQVLMQRFGSESVKGEVIQEIIDTSLKAALKQENIEAIGNFQLRSQFEDLMASFSPGQVFSFKAAVDVQPAVTLKNKTGFKLKAEEIKPNLEQVDTTLKDYQTRLATLVPVEGRAVKEGDVAVVDFYGRYTPADGEEQDVPGGKAESFQMDIEQDRFIPGFINGIIGMNAGDTKELAVSFPEDYSAAELAGCPAKFSITVHEVKERELPALDDEFAKEVSDGEYETIAALRQMLVDRYSEEAADKTKQNKETVILNELLNHIEVELPETLIDREIDSMLMQSAYQLQSQGIDVRQLFNQDTIPRLKESSRPEAINRLKRTMALGEIAKQENLTVDPVELTAKIAETMSEMAGQDVDPDRLRSVLSEEMLKDQIITWIESGSTIELVAEGSLQPEDAEAEAVKEEKAGKKAKAKDEAKAEKAKDEPKKAEPKAEKAKDEAKAEKPKAEKAKDEPKAEKAKDEAKAEKPKAEPKAEKAKDEKPKAKKKK
jgi:trigger factor